MPRVPAMGRLCLIGRSRGVGGAPRLRSVCVRKFYPTFTHFATLFPTCPHHLHRWWGVRRQEAAFPCGFSGRLAVGGWTASCLAAGRCLVRGDRAEQCGG